MSNERRHELENNELAVLLGRFNKAIEPYSRIIAVALIAAAVVSLGYLLFRSQQSGQRSDATLQLIQAVASQDAEVLLDVGESYPETAAGAWARLYQGEQYLSQGIDSLYANRQTAEDLLNDSQAAFRAAISLSADNSSVRAATLRSHCAYESGSCADMRPKWSATSSLSSPVVAVIL